MSVVSVFHDCDAVIYASRDNLFFPQEEDVVRFARVKKKGYVRLTTNVGPLNLELHCDYVPKTCENFMKLCQRGYYNGTKFHRSIRHFMVRNQVSMCNEAIS